MEKETEIKTAVNVSVAGEKPDLESEAKSASTKEAVSPKKVAPKKASAPKKIPFAHLHTHSHYSLLSALPKIDDLVDAAKKDGMKALALTDNGNMYGTIEFFKACKKAEIKPIIGVDAYMAMAPRTRFDMQAGVDNRRARIVLLAENMEGYKNLVHLVTKSYLEGFYYKPRMDYELLTTHKNGIIAIIPSFSGEVALALKRRDIGMAKERIADYKKIYGPDNLYLEITRHPEIDNHEAIMRELVTLAKETDTKIMAAHDVYYMNPEDKIARDTLTLVNSHGDGSDLSSGESEEDFSFISQKRANELFQNDQTLEEGEYKSSLPSALENTAQIAERCNVNLELGKWVFPAIETPAGQNYDEALRSIVYEGFNRRPVEKTEEVITRIEYELLVIKNKGYAPYFLIVADLLKFARENGILSNIRGSVSGSMVTYMAGITNINPIEYEIPFERFLNPDRPSAPDIDMDYADNRRDEMVDYARRKYGADKVAQIGTFGTMAARGSVRDVTRALGFPYELGDRLAKLIPMGSQGFPMTIEYALEITPELDELYKKNPDVTRIIDTAKKIEGCARHISIHAAGVVIAPTELTDFTPLQYDPKGEKKIISQYDMYSIEEAGLLKFDFLGLKNLSIIADSFARVKENYGKVLSVDTTPIDDKKTFEMLARGETVDLFQLNGEGMTKFLVELKPTSIHDINAMVALYRPGPIQFIPEYIARKHKPSLIKYLDPALEPILQKTYGILVYQDDLLMMAHKLAGYTWGEVDKFRKAVGKKIPEEMAQQKEKFIKGCVEKSGWKLEKAQEIWSWIEPFAAYGFNKAHSVSYGMVAYQTAYLKANFPGEYMTSVLCAEAGDTEKVAESVAECRRIGIPVLPPDINESFAQFALIKGNKDSDVELAKKDRIRFGLVTIKNFGQGAADAIIKERTAGGPFKSLSDFLDRVSDKGVNKKALEALIMSGALDMLGERGSMLGNIETFLVYAKDRAKQNKMQDSLFGLMKDADSLPKFKMIDVPPTPKKQKLAWEKELLGLYISGHPLDPYRDAIAKNNLNIAKIKGKKKEQNEGEAEAGEQNMAQSMEHKTAQNQTQSDAQTNTQTDTAKAPSANAQENEIKPESLVVIAGIIETVRPILTKKGDAMAFLRFSDFSGSIDVVAFPKIFTEYKKLLVPDKVLAIKGKVAERNGERSIIIDKIKEL